VERHIPRGQISRKLHIHGHLVFFGCLGGGGDHFPFTYPLDPYSDVAAHHLFNIA
jgi:hypothetical protein